MSNEISLDIQLPEMSDQIFPVSVHVRPECNLVVWKLAPIKNIDSVSWQNIQSCVAHKMDRLSDLLSDYLQFGPLIALLDVSNCENSDWNEFVGDQDWHRGRFIVQSVNQIHGENLDTVQSRWEGSLQSAKYSIRKITGEDLLELVEDASKIARPPKGVDKKVYSRYVDNLLFSLRNQSYSNMAESWESELKQDLNTMLGEFYFE